MALDKLTVKLVANGHAVKTWTGIEDATADVALSESRKYTSGTAANQADVVYQKEITIASNTTHTIDLSGTLNDPTGANVVMAKLKGLIVINAPATSDTPNTTTIQIGGGSNCIPLFADLSDKTKTLDAGSIFHMENPSANGLCSITAGTADLLAIANSTGASATIQVLAWGTSA